MCKKWVYILCQLLRQLFPLILTNISAKNNFGGSISMSYGFIQYVPRVLGLFINKYDTKIRSETEKNNVLCLWEHFTISCEHVCIFSQWGFSLHHSIKWCTLNYNMTNCFILSNLYTCTINVHKLVSARSSGKNPCQNCWD